MNQTPSGERIHIGIFGRCNAGKSSLLNALTGQQAAVVSQLKGTTTDPVYKSMEVLPLGPVLFMDTPGLDDESGLGEQRLEKMRQALRRTELALVVFDLSSQSGLELERRLLRELAAREIPCLLVWNKADVLGESEALGRLKEREQELRNEGFQPVSVAVSALCRKGIEKLWEALGSLAPKKRNHPLCRDLFRAGETVVLVIPLDQAAPKGRLILPQQQVIREILEGEGIPVLTSVEGLPRALEKMKEAPVLVITDSQAFEQVGVLVPETIKLTSFSILFARYKGSLSRQLAGTAALADLKDGDKILIAEGCTHRRQCGDIGTEKLPAWLRKRSGVRLEFCFSRGAEFPERLGEYQVILHCGGCMLNQGEMDWRLGQAESQGIPMSNYGMAIAWLKGILPRALEPFLGAEGFWGEGGKSVPASGEERGL